MTSSEVVYSDKDCFTTEQTGRGTDPESKKPLQPKPKRHFGKNIVFCWFNNEPLLNIGPQWLLFTGTFLVLVAVGLAIFFIVGSSEPEALRYSLLGAVALEATLFLYTGLKNPGIMTAADPNDPQIKDLENHQNFCPVCKILRDETTFHCLDCDVCIKGFDHHCPWTGKCIGAGNTHSFYTFIILTFFYFLFCVGIIVHSVVSSKSL